MNSMLQFYLPTSTLSFGTLLQFFTFHTCLFSLFFHCSFSFSSYFCRSNSKKTSEEPVAKLTAIESASQVTYSWSSHSMCESSWQDVFKCSLQEVIFSYSTVVLSCKLASLAPVRVCLTWVLWLTLGKFLCVPHAVLLVYRWPGA